MSKKEKKDKAKTKSKSSDKAKKSSKKEKNEDCPSSPKSVTSAQGEDAEPQKIWIRLVSSQKHNDWIHKPLDVTGDEPEPTEEEFVSCMQFVIPQNSYVSKHLYVLWHFHRDCMDSCRLFADREEGREAFQEQMQISAQYLKDSEDCIHVVKIADNSDRWESSKYEIKKKGDYTKMTYADDGDRWILEKVKVPKHCR